MAEEIAFKNKNISNFQGLLTLDPVILHMVGHHSSTSTYTPKSLKSKKLFVDKRMYTHTHINGHLRPTLLGRLEVDVKIKARFWLDVCMTFGQVMDLAYSYSRRTDNGLKVTLKT